MSNKDQQIDADNFSKITINFIGCGRLGQTLAQLFKQHNLISEINIVCSSHAGAAKVCAKLGFGRAAANLQQLPAADLWLLAVPDDALATIVQQLADYSAIAAQSVMMHCSGVYDLEIFAPLQAKGCASATVHPIKSFAEPINAAKDFAGTYCSIKAMPRALPLVSFLFKQIGAQLIDFAGDKALYHAAMVFASNFVNVISYASQKTLKKSGVSSDMAMRLCNQIMHNTLENIKKLGPKAALTGPALRGDTATIAKHIVALEKIDSEYTKVYKQLSKIIQTEMI